MSDIQTTLETITMGPFFEHKEYGMWDNGWVPEEGQQYFVPNHSWDQYYLMGDMPNATSLIRWIQNYVNKKYGNMQSVKGAEAENAFNTAVSAFDTALIAELKKKGFQVEGGNDAIIVNGNETHCGFKILKTCDPPSDETAYEKCFKQRFLEFTPAKGDKYVDQEGKALDIEHSMAGEGGRKRRRRRRKSKKKTKRKTKKRKSKRKTKRKTKKRRKRKSRR